MPQNKPQGKSAAYWQKRFLDIEAASNAYGIETIRQIEPAFAAAQKQIQKEIEAWYGRYAKNNGVSMDIAKKQLSSKELKELKWDVNEYIKYGRQNALDGNWMKELENASARFHISRLEALKIRTQQAAEVAFGNELDAIDKMARKVFTEDYYHSIFEMQKGFGIGWEIGQIDERKLNTLVKKPWAADSKTFSQRIWQQRSQLVNELHTQLTRTCVLGKAPDDAIKAISKKFNTTQYQAGRLVMTEQAFFHSVAQKDAFDELDVEEFEIVATLDSHTSEICQEMDGKVFPMSQYEAGVTAPPFHVFCRTVTVPYFDDNFTGERAARGADGKTYYVPDGMKYGDWKEYFVDKTKDPADWLQPMKPVVDNDFKEITDAIDFNDGKHTQEEYQNWMDAYDKHNSDVKLTEKELEIIENYTEGGFIGFNGVSRGMEESLLKKGYTAESIERVRKQADVLEDVLSRYELDTNIVTHRFERDVSWLTGKGNDVEDLEKLIGTEYVAKGFTSSGMLPNRFRFTGGKADAVHFEIVTPQGTNGAFLSMSKKGEHEFLYNRNTKFKVLDGGERVVKEQKFNIKTMKMEEVEIKEHFLKVQVIPDSIDRIAEKVDKVKAVKDSVADIVKFKPATTIEEAEEYAQQFVVDLNARFADLSSKYNYTAEQKERWFRVNRKYEGVVSYKGLSVESANTLNETLTELYDAYDLPKLSNIKPMNFRENKWKNAQKAPAAYQNMYDGNFFINNHLLKNKKAMDAYFEEGEKAYKICLENIDKFKGKDRKMVETYIKAGRQLVSGEAKDRMKAIVQHEMGHHLQNQILYKDKEAVAIAKKGFDEYAIKVSGYATHSLGEYIAESFCAMLNGEADRIDPALKAYFERLKK